MNILLTNDDGINAEGLNSLYEVLSKYYNTCIIAPDREVSACSNAFTIHSALRVKKLEHNKFAVSGYPADCVSIALHSDLCFDPDIIVSGINHGSNIGDDLFFSGTVAGARSGFIFGRTGIAVSIDSYHMPSKYFYDAAEFIHSFIEDNRKEIERKALFFNINYPELPADQIRGVKYTFTGKRIYKDSYSITCCGNDEMIMNLEGEMGSIPEKGSDITELTEGYISVTPLTIDCTDFSYLENIDFEKQRKVIL